MVVRDLFRQLEAIAKMRSVLLDLGESHVIKDLSHLLILISLAISRIEPWEFSPLVSLEKETKYSVVNSFKLDPATEHHVSEESSRHIHKGKTDRAILAVNGSTVDSGESC